MFYTVKVQISKCGEDNRWQFYDVKFDKKKENYFCNSKDRSSIQINTGEILVKNTHEKTLHFFFFLLLG